MTALKIKPLIYNKLNTGTLPDKASVELNLS
jgi:hypothetical protein